MTTTNDDSDPNVPWTDVLAEQQLKDRNAWFDDSDDEHFDDDDDNNDDYNDIEEVNSGSHWMSVEEKVELFLAPTSKDFPKVKDWKDIETKSKDIEISIDQA